MKVKLKDIAAIRSGVYVKADPAGDVEYWQVRNVDSERGSGSQPVKVRDIGISSKHYLMKDDLLFSTKGASIFCIRFEGTGKKAIASSSFFAIRIASSAVLPEFICCYLNTPSVLNMLKSASVGTAIQSIPQTVLQNIDLNIPSLDIQRLVVKIDELRKKEEQIMNRIVDLKRNLQDQLLKKIK